MRTLGNLERRAVFDKGGDKGGDKGFDEALDKGWDYLLVVAGGRVIWLGAMR